MQGLYDDVAARITADCPLVLQATTAMDAQEAFKALVVSDTAVTAVVSPLGDAAVPVRDVALVTSQLEVWEFGVTLGLVYPGGMEQFEPARDEIKVALKGWRPDGAARPIQYAGGRNLSYSIDQKGGRWLWLLRFRVPVLETHGVQE